MTDVLVVDPTPTVSDAIATRRSVRAFLPDPVSESLVREILATASRSASGGNLQPWKVNVLAGQARDHFVAAVAEDAVDEGENQVGPAIDDECNARLRPAEVNARIGRP